MDVMSDNWGKPNLYENNYIVVDDPFGVVYGFRFGTMGESFGKRDQPGAYACAFHPIHK